MLCLVAVAALLSIIFMAGKRNIEGTGPYLSIRKGM